jgi:hypothetical protein
MHVQADNTWAFTSFKQSLPIHCLAIDLHSLQQAELVEYVSGRPDTCFSLRLVICPRAIRWIPGQRLRIGFAIAHGLSRKVAIVPIGERRRFGRRGLDTSQYAVELPKNEMKGGPWG